MPRPSRTAAREREAATVTDEPAAAGRPPAWVYLLRCRDGSLYTGWTSDLDGRIARHRAGTASRYTASRLPVALAAALPMATRTAARREEARIKGLPRREKLALVATAGETLAVRRAGACARPA